MSYGPELDRLSAACADQPDGLGFAALADGLRKHGDLAAAQSVANSGLARHPGFVPGLLALAAIQRTAGLAADSLKSLHTALGIDPSHPVVLDRLAQCAAENGDSGAATAWRQALDASLPADSDQLLPSPATEQAIGSAFAEEFDTDTGTDEPLITESMAALYEHQGHLERAHDLYAALAARDPANLALAARRDALVGTIKSHRPLPYAAEATGAISLGDWLGLVVASEAEPKQAPGGGYDEFFEPPPVADDAADFEAFQAWLKGLPR